ncbi:MAG: lasso peptide biosynthesis protein [Bacteroidales bacterium]|nr:lasso peptide biosynthesis protein [Bacteroidales bacterium]
MSKFISFCSLTIKEKIIFFQIVIIAFLLPLLKIIPIKVYFAKIRKYNPQNLKTDINKLFTLYKVYKIFEKNTPIKLKCFSKSVLACILLRINKIPYELHLSWQNEQGTIKLHTFVSSNGYYFVKPVKNFKTII